MTTAVAPSGPVNKWLVAASVGFGSLMATIDSSIINVALPNIRGELGASIQEITWISTAYMIAMVLIMPLTGFLGRFFGQKRVYLTAMAMFVGGSVLCGTARSLPALVAYRIIQGFGGGALQPTQQAILRTTFPPEEQGMAMALFTMVIMVGPAVGPLLGGYITDNYAWPWIFYINVPIGVIGILMTVQNVHEPEDVRAANRARAEIARKHLDIAGVILMVIGIAALEYFFEEGAQKDWFDSFDIRVAAFVCVVSLAAWVIRELTATEPIVNLRLFRDPTFASATAIAFVMYAMLIGTMFLLPVFTQESLHYTATLAGIVLLPRTLAMMVCSPIIGRLYNRIQPAFLVGFGVVLFAVGTWQLSHVSLETSSTNLILPLVITGAGFAFLFVPLTTIALAKIPRHLLGDAAGLNSFVRQIGGSVGLTAFATLFTHFSAEARTAVVSHLTLLRPEVQARFAELSAHSSPTLALHTLSGRAAEQSAVLGFDRLFFLQGVLFIGVIPMLFFLRVPRADASSEPIDVAID